MKIEDIPMGTVVSFETVIGERYNNYKFVGVIPWYIVENLGVDTVALDSQYRPAMKPPAPLTFRDYQFLAFRTPDNQTVYFGSPWVKEDSVEITGAESFRITIPNPTERQMRSVRSMLIALGLDNVIIEAID